ncbi:MAG: MlaD family protein [Candidatus Aceula meridiana]|nr:MlaD family protein [Candidatus Aceula meridiana]
MSRKANKKMIGLFAVGALVLLIIGILVLGSGTIFKKTNKFVLYFDGSVKGLSIGAPVMFRGVSIGIVKDISLIYDSKAGTIILPVVIEIEEGRIEGTPSFSEPGGVEKMIEFGLRGKIEVQNFLTGQLMISFDFSPEEPVQLRGISKAYSELPTLPTSGDIFELMNELPIKEIAKNLEAIAKEINRLVNSSDLRESFYELPETLKETKQSMRSFRFLTEYLEQHPEAILKGKTGEQDE